MNAREATILQMESHSSLKQKLLASENLDSYMYNIFSSIKRESLNGFTTCEWGPGFTHAPFSIQTEIIDILTEKLEELGYVVSFNPYKGQKTEYTIIVNWGERHVCLLFEKGDKVMVNRDLQYQTHPNSNLEVLKKGTILTVESAVPNSVISLEFGKNVSIIPSHLTKV